MMNRITHLQILILPQKDFPCSLGNLERRKIRFTNSDLTQAVGKEEFLDENYVSNWEKTCFSEAGQRLARNRQIKCRLIKIHPGLVVRIKWVNICKVLRIVFSVA